MSVGGIGANHIQGAELELHAASAASGPAHAPAAHGLATLRIGARGPEVKELQQELVAAGFKVVGGADGIYGRNTASAVAQLQRASGLPATGEADAATRAALAKKAGAAATVASFKLSPADGGFGPHTLTASVGGKSVTLATDAYRAFSLAGGRYLAWTNPRGAGGFENEGQGLMLFDAKTGKTTQVASESFMIEDVKSAHLPDGRDALLVAMTDGGLGLDRLAVVDPARGETARLDGAVVKKVEGSTLTATLKGVDGETGEIVSKGTKTFDLAKLLSQPVMHNRREGPG
ncbi:MAG TPA: peptidoglycan-binding domain-containing protein [Planctomycetota bacterium]|nr:peptidoglycan-binding domain-containing protein [Planctomycetota bacterium]